jgi:hypothetical protein
MFDPVWLRAVGLVIGNSLVRSQAQKSPPQTEPGSLSTKVSRVSLPRLALVAARFIAIVLPSREGFEARGLLCLQRRIRPFRNRAYEGSALTGADDNTSGGPCRCTSWHLMLFWVGNSSIRSPIRWFESCWRQPRSGSNRQRPFHPYQFATVREEFPQYP